MKKSYHIFASGILLFMICVIVIGYASLTDQLSLHGNVSTEIQVRSGIYITKVEVFSTSSNGITVEHEDIFPTNLKTTVVTSGQSPTVTFAITVYNETDITYWYQGVTAYSDYGQNTQVNKKDGLTITTKDTSASNSGNFDTDDWVPPRTERTFYATYTFGTNARGTVSAMVNFNFGLRIDSVKDNFLQILNDQDPSSPDGYYYLTSLFDNSGSTILGQVGSDKDDFDVLFGSNPKIQLEDGTEVPVTVMVQRANVDKKDTGDSYADGSHTGCEYTVYITMDDLSVQGGNVTVYAATYTCGADGVWYQLGELYEGTCPKMDYETSEPGQPEQYEGAFDLTQWVAVQKRYQVSTNLIYGTGYQHENFNKYVTIGDLMTVKDQDFYNGVNNNLKTALLMPACNTVYRYEHAGGGKPREYPNEKNMDKQGYAGLKAAYDKIAPYCINDNGGTDVRIENVQSMTRAELVYLIKQLQTAYDYYCELNPNG